MRASASAVDHARVLLVGLEEEHVGHGNEAQVLPEARLDPLQPLLARPAAKLRGELRDDGLEVRRRARELALQALDRNRQPLVGVGLEDVVDRPRLERLDRVLVVGGHEHHVRAVGPRAAPPRRPVISGIWMSRNMKSGARSSRASRAAAPSSTEAMISSSGQSFASLASSWARRIGSSSARSRSGFPWPRF